MPKQKQHIKTKATSLNTTPAGNDSWIVRSMDAFIECSFTKEVEKVNARKEKINKIYGEYLSWLWWVVSIAAGIIITLYFPDFITMAGLLTCSKAVPAIVKIFKPK